MSSLSKSLCWATSLILLAVGNSAGLVCDANASTMFVVIPVLAVLSVRSRCKVPA